MALKVFGGTAHPEFTAEVCSILGLPEGQKEIIKFSNDCTFVKVLESVRGDDVFVVQPSYAPVNDGLMELLIMVDALRRASAERITAVLPYFPYAKSDKKDQPRIAITARLVANLLETAGVDRVLSIDLHAAQIMGFFTKPVDHLTSLPLLANHFRQIGMSNFVVVAPDAGRAKLARAYGKRLGVPIALLDKHRIGNEERVEVDHLVGDVNGRNVLLVEDEIASGGTMIAEATFLSNAGAQEIHVACTHGIFSGKAIQRIMDSSLTQVVVTNTLPLAPEKRISKIVTISVAGLFAEAISRIHGGESVSVLFD